jgi:hypothetical protein
MRKLIHCLLPLLVLIPSVWSASVTQRTTGACSPAVADVKGNVTITCEGVKQNEINELVKIFNEGLRSFQEFQKQILERQPDISIRCNPDQQGDPSKILCSVTNNGRAEARDLTISFAKLLPLDTVVQAPPELGLKIEEAGSPPDPKNSPLSATLLTAFLVRIPRVAPKDHFNFTVLTTNDDNLRTAKQVMKIRTEIIDVLQKFGERLNQVYPNEAQKWNFKDVLGARVKQENFYTPTKFYYEKGRFPVEFLTEAESLAAAINEELYARYKQEFIDIYKNRPSYSAPVIRIRGRGGERTYSSHPPYLKSCFGGMARIPEKSQTIDIPIQVPNYDKDKC